ncbi:hypothetical protein OE88DRAFT_1663205 [Heliocybe sulcata]|uniref:Uncharacterized protein n=1 Tax=Heliocybe sulcata TaxID=5364 RepID=A0A5C3N591_9AGAM|nr:hypothetical protein OE88DRAFT_1663205 [Heliocybe sulcata]
MSAPIDIPRSSSAASSQEKYVPVHRRKQSGSSSSSSSRSSSPNSTSASLPSSLSSKTSVSVYPQSSENHIPLIQYTPAELLALAASPLSRIAPAAYATIVSVAPEIVVSRSAAKRNVNARRRPGQRRAGVKKMVWAPSESRNVRAVVVQEGDLTWRSHP